MQKKKGISLIVLVITIIVMTVLAGAIILTLNNSGIIDKATDAVEQTNLATVKELTQMAWAEAYATGERTEEGLKAAVNKALTDSKIDTSKYTISVTNKGVKVEVKNSKTSKWVQQGLTVTNGEIILEIGDNILYDETNGGTITGLVATEWKVLGASEDGELLIMSTEDVDLPELYGKQEYLTAENVMHTTCEAYGKGKGAKKARAIIIDDIDKVTGYDKTTYGKGQMNEYGNEVTYIYNGTSTPTYTSTNGKTGTYSGGKLYYYNGTEFILFDNFESGEVGTEIVTVKSTGYTYVASNLETIDEGTKAFEMLFGEKVTDSYGDEHYTAEYAIATPFVEFDGSSSFRYYFSMVSWDWIGCVCDSFTSSGREDWGGLYCTRPVVILSPDIQLTGSSEMGWTLM